MELPFEIGLRLKLPFEIGLRLILAFLFGLTCGFLIAIYMNTYRLWGKVLKLTRRKPEVCEVGEDPDDLGCAPPARVMDLPGDQFFKP